MNSDEISWLMQLHPTFIGVFPIDQLPTPVRADTCFIVNTDSSNLPGKHWLAIRVNTNKEAYYFDSLCSYPVACIANHLLRYVTKLYYITESIQNPLTNLCGHFCVQYLYCHAVDSNPIKFINNLKLLIS